VYKEFEYLLSEISASESKEFGAMIKLIDEEHIDYIEDVLTERFDIEYKFKTMDEEKKEYILYFEDNCNLDTVKVALKTINEDHSLNQELYETI